MQTQPPPIPDPVSIWWGPAFRAARSLPDIPVMRPRAQIGTAITLAVISLFISLFAPVCWWHANHELARIKNGDCSDVGRGWLLVALCVGVFATCMLLVVMAVVIATVR